MMFLGAAAAEKHQQGHWQRRRRATCANCMMSCHNHGKYGACKQWAVAGLGVHADGTLPTERVAVQAAMQLIH